MRLRLIPLLALLGTGCAPRQYSLLRHQGREYLLPPGMRKAPAILPRPEIDCAAGVPATPRASHYAVYGCYVNAGFVDLRPGMRLKIVRPVVSKGEALKTEVVAQQGLNLTVRSNVIGVDTQFLDVGAQPAGGATLDAGFSASMTHFRLFFLARELDRGRKITLIGARSAHELETATHSLAAYCNHAAAPCLAVSDGTVIGVQVAVIVAGKSEFFPLGASVREALPKEVNPTRVKLSRLWHGKLAAVTPAGPNAPSLLGLPLNGGDSIFW
jgi:hypothetical protein